MLVHITLNNRQVGKVIFSCWRQRKVLTYKFQFNFEEIVLLTEHIPRLLHSIGPNQQTLDSVDSKIHGIPVIM